MTGKPVIFVSSSSEAKEIDKIIRSKLEELDAIPKHWKDFKTFPPGSTVLTKLLELAPKIDGALLIATADDLIDFRGDKRYSPRDNIVFEMGIFLAHLGEERAGIVHVRDNKSNILPKLPTNLDGLATLRFEPEHPLSFDSQLSDWLETVKSLRPKSKLLNEIKVSILPKLAESPEQWSTYLDRYIVGPFKQSVEYIARGELLLSIGEYYHSLYKETDTADESTKIMAVSILSSRIWTEDNEQKQYINKNIEAAARGAEIRRLFILQQNEWGDFKKVLELQKKSGIKVKFADSNLLINVDGLKDMAIFQDTKLNTSRIYIVDEVLGNPNRIYGAKLILKPDLQQLLIDVFEKAWMKSADYSQKIFSGVSSNIDKKRVKAPGENMKVYKLAQPVISCEDAASAKSIPLSNELKSLILQTSMGIVCLHSTGDAKISLRAVKELLQVKEAYIAPYEKLKDMGISPGTASAVLEPVWSLPHLISRRVLKQRFVSTNNGTLRGYFKFDPRILLSSSAYKIGDFEYSQNSNEEQLL